MDTDFDAIFTDIYYFCLRIASVTAQIVLGIFSILRTQILDISSILRLPRLKTEAGCAWCMTPSAAWQTLSGWGYGYFSEISKTNSNQRAMTKKWKPCALNYLLKICRAVCAATQKTWKLRTWRRCRGWWPGYWYYDHTKIAPLLKLFANKNDKYPWRSHQNPCPKSKVIEIERFVDK